jgi:rod shape-determining protein MreC
VAQSLSPFVRYKAIINMLVAGLLALVIISSDESPTLKTLRGVIIDASEYLYVPFQWLETIFQIERDYRELEKQYIASQLEINRLKTLAQENTRLRQALGFKQIKGFDVIPANVLSNTSSFTMSSLTIDQGAVDGVELLAAVVDAQAQLVGKVVEVGENTSLVQLVSDKNFRVSVREMRSRNVGILSYSRQGGYEIRDVPKNASIIAGDSVVTSGFSDIFPEYIFVGWVSDISPVIEDYVKSVKVNIASDFNRLEEVFILRRDV